jgi:hypothetical protein
MLLELGEDLGYPSVTLGTLTLTGEVAWRAAAARAAPIERRTWLRGLSDALLVATPQSRARMDAWLRSPVRLPATPEWIREHLLFYGDDSMFGPVCEAFQFMPEAVRDFVLREAAILAVGASSYGWTGSSNFVDRDGIGRPRVIVLSGAAPHAASLIHATLHESAHAWSCPTPYALVSVQGEAGFRAYVAKEGLTERVDKKVAFDERVACALAAVWVDSVVET